MKLVIALGTLFIIGAVVFFISTRILIFSDEEIVVLMDDESYKPDFINISAETKVTWINKGNSPKWPASNFHPTHSMYPEKSGCIGSKFDACKPLKTNEKFSFVFDKVGHWGVHDHLFPGITMAVEVLDYKGTNNARELNKESLRKHDQGLFRDLSFKEQSEIVTELISLDTRHAWEFLKKAFIVNGAVIGNAHEFAHVIGNNIYKSLGLEGIVICDEAFAYGCYHGVTEEMFKKGDPQNIREVQKYCLDAFPPSQTRNYTGCIHGIGHGLATLYGLDMKKTLKDCDLLEETYRTFCYDGVFMEYAFIVSPADLNPQNPWELCESLEQEYQYNCARYQVPLFRQILGWDFVRAAEECFVVKSKILQEACMATLGHMVAQSAIGDTEEIRKICGQILSEEGIPLCIMNAAIEIVFQKYNGWEDSPKTLCGELDLSWKEKCLHSAQGKIF